MKTQSSMSKIKNVLKLSEDFKSSKPLNEFYESVDLVTSKITNLFVKRPLNFLLKKSLKIAIKSDLTKKKIISNCMSVGYDNVLEILENLSKEEMKKIGSEFFYITALKFAKNQSIATFAKFLNIMFRNYGFDAQFVRKFLYNERDFNECLSLFEYLRIWDSSQFEESIDQIIFDTLVICLNWFSSNIYVEEFFEFLNETQDLFNDKDPEQTQSVLKKLITSLIQSILTKKNSLDLFLKTLEKFKELKLDFNEKICVKILEIINRYTKNDQFLNSMINFMEFNDFKHTINSYNKVLDFYSMRGEFEKALEKFEELKDQNLKPDNFTYSIMIKGIKKMETPNLDLAENFFNKYIQDFGSNDLIIYNSIIDVFVSSGEIDRTNKIFEMIKENEEISPDQITYNTLIKGFCRIKNYEEADKYYIKMKISKFIPNRITYNSLMDLAVKIQNMKRALFYITEMQKDKISPDGFTYSIILNGLKINESSPNLVRSSLDKIKKVIKLNEFHLDEIFFNSILDVCAKYGFINYLDEFYLIMKEKKVRESSVTFGVLIKAYGKVAQFEKAYQIFEKMINSNMRINDITYGCILDACAKSGNMNIAMKIYKTLLKSQINLNSIVFTTIIKGFIRVEAYKEAIEFFDEVKDHKDLPGMIITFNCALDVLVRKKDMVNALVLFNKINNTFKADLISYSTIIKGFCQTNQLEKALDYVKRMINSKIEIDISVINLFLDTCSNKVDFKLGIKGYQYSMMKNVAPNEITFGIMVKIFGFSRELHKAFDLLDLMKVYDIKPSIIIYTNLIHISFYNRNARKAELSFSLMRKDGIKGDKLMYSKLIDGLIRFRQYGKVPKYIMYALKDNCCLKPATIEAILKQFGSDPEIVEKIELIRLNYGNEKTIEKKQRNLKFKNKFNEENPKKFKKIIQDRKIKNEEQWKSQNKNKVMSSRGFFKKDKKEGDSQNFKTLKTDKSNGGNNYIKFNQKPKMTMFNFRKNSRNTNTD